MRAIRALLVVSLVVTSSGAFGAQASPITTHVPRPNNWMELACQTVQNPYECYLAYSWHWLREIGHPIIAPAVNTSVDAGTIYWSTWLIRKFGGTTPEIELVLSGSRAAMKAGTVVAGLGIVLSAATAAIFFAITPTTATPSMDERQYVQPDDTQNSTLSAQCQGVLQKYTSSPKGVQDLINLPSNQRQALLPCIAENHEFSQFLINGALQGQQLNENQMQAH